MDSELCWGDRPGPWESDGAATLTLLEMEAKHLMVEAVPKGRGEEQKATRHHPLTSQHPVSLESNYANRKTRFEWLDSN